MRPRVRLDAPGCVFASKASVRVLRELSVRGGAAGNVQVRQISQQFGKGPGREEEEDSSHALDIMWRLDM